MANLWNAQETERLIADPVPGIQAVPHEDNLRYFDVKIDGPAACPFEGAAPQASLYEPETKEVKLVI